MSSTGLPTLTIDVATRRGERLIAGAILAMLPFAILAMGFTPAVSVVTGVLLLGVVALCFGAIGWVTGGRRLCRIVCRQDGQWLLVDAEGRTIEAKLSCASRVSVWALWLRWSDRALRPLLLFAGDIAPEDYRRLLVRLRLAPFPHGDERNVS
jgi:hypothetical protein